MSPRDVPLYESRLSAESPALWIPLSCGIPESGTEQRDFCSGSKSEVPNKIPARAFRS